MSILSIILISFLGILGIIGFYFRDKILLFVKYHWKKIFAIVSGGLIIGGGSIIMDVDPPAADLGCTLLFAGNLGGAGAPKWQYAEDGTEAANGYYINMSRQTENWIYINMTSDDATAIIVHWYNASLDGGTWYNDTSSAHISSLSFTEVGNYWEFNSSGNITTTANNKYSFDIYATLGGDSDTVVWEKIGIGGGATRRYVYLGCTATTAEYVPFYLLETTDETLNPSYGVDDKGEHDRLTYDGGPDGRISDCGYACNDTLTDTVHDRWCDGFVAYFFSQPYCTADITISNVYFRSYLASNLSAIKADIRSTRGVPFAGIGIGKTLAKSDVTTWITYNDGEAKTNASYGLYCGWETISPTESYTDNSIYELYAIWDAPAASPSIICNQSIRSYILFNVPNGVLSGSDSRDTDGDDVTDHSELITHKTSPFHTDSDNDGIDDNYELALSTDPNDYTDTPTLDYSSAIRTNGIDYFIWMGANVSAYTVAKSIRYGCGVTFGTESEYIAQWNQGGTWDADANVDGLWYKFYPHDSSGHNLTINTFDVVQVVISDNVGEKTIQMQANPSWVYTTTRDYSLLSSQTVTQGISYTGYVDDTTRTLVYIGDNDIAAVLVTGDIIAVWDDTNYEWDYHIVNIYEPGYSAEQYDIVYIKIGPQRVWTLPGTA